MEKKSTYSEKSSTRIVDEGVSIIMPISGTFLFNFVAISTIICLLFRKSSIVEIIGNITFTLSASFEVRIDSICVLKSSSI